MRKLIKKDEEAGKKDEEVCKKDAKVGNSILNNDTYLLSFLF